MLGSLRPILQMVGVCKLVMYDRESCFGETHMVFHVSQMANKRIKNSLFVFIEKEDTYMYM